MKHIFKILFLLLSLSLFSQSPWTQKKGKFYTQFSFSSIGAYNELFGETNQFTERLITDQTLQLFGEYGVTNKTSFILSVPFKITKTGAATISDGIETKSSNEQAFGNISFGIKHNLSNKNWLLTTQFTVETNTGTYFAESGIRTGFDAWSFNPLISTGKGFNKTYIQAYLGAELRTSGYSSNLRFGGEFGYKVLKPLWIVGFLDISSSLKNGDIMLPIQNQRTALYVNDIEFSAYGIKAIAELSKTFGLTTSFATAFSGNNVPKQTAISLGLYQKW